MKGNSSGTLRGAVIRLATERPELRQHLVPVLRKTAMEFPTEDALKTYLKEHPDADRSLHTVKKPEKDSPKTEEKPSSGFFSKVKAKFKSIKDSIATAIENAPAEVQKFILEEEHRHKRLGEVIEAVKAAPKKIGEKILSSAKAEVTELKQAGHATQKFLRGETLTKEDKHALYSTAVYVGGAVLTAATSGAAIAAIGAVSKSFSLHVAIKAVDALLDEGFLGFEALETGLSALRHILAAEKKELTDAEAQEVLVNALIAHTLKQYEKGISDKDMASILKGVEFPK